MKMPQMRLTAAEVYRGTNLVCSVSKCSYRMSDTGTYTLRREPTIPDRIAALSDSVKLSSTAAFVPAMSC